MSTYSDPLIAIGINSGGFSGVIPPLNSTSPQAVQGLANTYTGPGDMSSFGQEAASLFTGAGAANTVLQQTLALQQQQAQLFNQFLKACLEASAAQKKQQNQALDANNANGGAQEDNAQENNAAVTPNNDGAANNGANNNGAATNAKGAVMEVAKELASYKWEYYYDDKKSDAQTQSSKAGNCCDLAQLAISKLKQKGIEGKLVLGDIKSSDYNGGHYWIEYKDPSTGKWEFFDPTACATNKSAERGFQGLHATYAKRK
jgi:hypothetical protein